MSVLCLTIDLPFLAREVNSAHAEVQFHAKSMLLEAKRAGEALLKAKTMVRHGEFKAWVEANCRCSYRQAAKYMQIAKSASRGISDPSLGINAFLDAHAARRVEKTATATPTFTKEDAEYALKINARAERGEGGEREVAQAKLEKIASEFGLTADEMVEKAKELCPEPVPLSPLDAAVKQMMAPYERLPKQTLLAVLLKCFATHPDLIDTIEKEFSRD